MKPSEISLICIGHKYVYETECTVRIFLPGEKILVKFCPDSSAADEIITRLEDTGKEILLSTEINLSRFSFLKSQKLILPRKSDDSAIERGFGVLLYELLSKATGIRPPWGILTGVRPVRLCRRLQSQGLGKDEIAKVMVNDYLVSPQKASLATSVLISQRDIIIKNTPDSFSLYVNIPFCPGRCLYCSFVSADIAKKGALLPRYIELLKKEIVLVGEIARKKRLNLHTIYLGGGTPTALSAGQLGEILATINRNFDISSLMEYTVESGRPDTITAEKLDVMRGFGVSRISVNPQTMNDSVLQNIGRSHTGAQTVEAFELARKMGFSCINMDMIAGLPGESAEIFENSLKTVLALRPENITIHTLTIKRSSSLRAQPGVFSTRIPLGDMIATAQDSLIVSGYLPYYLYRQKGGIHNLENTGFSLPDAAGIYNIYSMEDIHTILAVGAGSVSKICANSRIKRIFATKFPDEYITGFDKTLINLSLIASELNL